VCLVAAEAGLPPATLHERALAALPLNQDDAVVVDGVRAVRRADRGDDAPGRRLAEQEAHRVAGVDAHVHQRPATREVGIGEPAPRPPVGMYAVAVRANDPSELAGRDRVA